MSATYEETNRIFLGRVTIQGSAPNGVPAAGDGIVENFHQFVIGAGLTNNITRRMRFRVLEVVLNFGGAATQVDLVPHTSRTNPAPNDYATETDTADTWHSAGGAQCLATATLAGGDTVEIAARGSRWVYLEGQNQVGAGTITADVYGIMSGPGGGW